MMSNQVESSRCPKCGSTFVSSAAAVCPHCAFTDVVRLPANDRDCRDALLKDIPKPNHQPRLIGDFELQEEIGRGAMGIIYKARQRSLDRIVALKLMLGARTADSEFCRRFQQEAETAAKLKHPNIVPIYEVGDDSGQPFFAMEFVAGTDFSKLTRSQPLPPKTAAHYLHILAETMAYAHQHGVLHRDLKPSNILLGMDDRPRITDFGLARQLNKDSSLTTSGVTLGTPGYLPPEQASVKFGEISVRSDVYSLGAVLFHLLTGRPPFIGGSVADTLQDVLQVEAPSPRALNPHVPADLATICLKCLRKMPTQRYENARALADDLGRFLRNEPVSARRTSLGKRFGKCIARQPVVTSLCCLIALLIFGAAWMWKLQRAETAQAKAESTRNEGAAKLAQADANREHSKSGLLFEFAKQKEAEAANVQPTRNEPRHQSLVTNHVSIHVNNVVPVSTEHERQRRHDREEIRDVSDTTRPTSDRPRYKPLEPLPNDAQHLAAASLTFFDVKGFENEIKRHLNSEGGVDEKKMRDAVNSRKFFRADPVLLAKAKAHGALESPVENSAANENEPTLPIRTTKSVTNLVPSPSQEVQPVRERGSGRVEMVENNQVWCSIGSADGLKLNDTVRIFYPKITDDPRTGLTTNYIKVAEIRASIVRQNTCVGVSSVPMNVGWIAVTTDVEPELQDQTAQSSAPVFPRLLSGQSNPLKK